MHAQPEDLAETAFCVLCRSTTCPGGTCYGPLPARSGPELVLLRNLMHLAPQTEWPTLARLPGADLVRLHRTACGLSDPDRRRAALLDYCERARALAKVRA